MLVSFEGRGDLWTGTAEIAERGEGDKHQPWTVKLSSGARAVEGTMHVTELAERAAAERAASDGGEAEALLGRAFEKALVAELGLRALASGFRFVLDHRWVHAA